MAKKLVVFFVALAIAAIGGGTYFHVKRSLEEEIRTAIASYQAQLPPGFSLTYDSVSASPLTKSTAILNLELRSDAWFGLYKAEEIVVKVHDDTFADFRGKGLFFQTKNSVPSLPEEVSIVSESTMESLSVKKLNYRHLILAANDFIKAESFEDALPTASSLLDEYSYAEATFENMRQTTGIGQEQSVVSIGSGQAKNFAHGTLESLQLKNIELSSANPENIFSLTFDSLGINNLRLGMIWKKALLISDAAFSGEDLPTASALEFLSAFASSFDLFQINGLRFAAGAEAKDPLFLLKALKLSNDKFIDDVLVSGSFSLDSLKLFLPPVQKDMVEAFLPGFSAETIEGSLFLASSVDIEKKTASLDDFTIDVTGLGRLKISLSLDGFDAARLGDLSQNSLNPFLTASLRSLRVNYTDDKLADILIDRTAPNGRENFAATVVSTIKTSFLQDNPDIGEKVANAVQQFLIGANGFELSFSPKEPIPLIMLPSLGFLASGNPLTVSGR